MPEIINRTSWSVEEVINIIPTLDEVASMLMEEISQIEISYLRRSKNEGTSKEKIYHGEFIPEDYKIKLRLSKKDFYGKPNPFHGETLPPLDEMMVMVLGHELWHCGEYKWGLKQLRKRWDHQEADLFGEALRKKYIEYKRK